MNAQEIAQYYLSHKGIEHDYKVEWQAERFLLMGKMAAMMGTDNQDRPVLTLKVKPEHSIDLRLRYPGKIVEGYYANKVHWVSIYLDCEQDSSLIKRLIDESYTLIFEGLTKKNQKIILEG